MTCRPQRWIKPSEERAAPDGMTKDIDAFVGTGPLGEAIAETAYVLTAERLRVDDTTVPLLARDGTRNPLALCSRRSSFRRHRVAGGGLPLFRRSRPRASGRRPQGPARHPQGRYLCGLQPLYYPKHKLGPVPFAPCWSHMRRKVLELADIESSLRDGRSAEDIADRLRGGEVDRPFAGRALSR